MLPLKNQPVKFYYLFSCLIQMENCFLEHKIHA